MMEDDGVVPCGEIDSMEGEDSDSESESSDDDNNFEMEQEELQNAQLNADCTSGDVDFLDESAYQPNSEELVGDEAHINADEPSVQRSGPVRSFDPQGSRPRPGPVHVGSETTKDRTKPT